MPAFASRITVAALLGATMLAMPLAASAQTTPQSTTTPSMASPSSTSPSTATTAPRTPRTAAAKAASSQPETVEQRIASLHRQLKITASEDAAWNAVAQAMRDNATQMQQLMDQRDGTSGQPMTAVDDLNLYQKFAQAHADGLKNLISSFDTLYNAMPDAQKKLADQVFSSARRGRG
jgi:protein CpxP